MPIQFKKLDQPSVARQAVYGKLSYDAERPLAARVLSAHIYLQVFEDNEGEIGILRGDKLSLALILGLLQVPLSFYQ